MPNKGAQEFWNGKYANEKNIWGEKPVKVIGECEAVFRNYGVKNILVMAAGYGRNGKYFTEKGYRVDGIEISDEAINIGKSFAPEINFIKGNVLDADTQKEYDAVFCFDIMQIFLKDERKTLVERCVKHCRPSGLVMLSCLSKADALFGKGREIEKDTFDGNNGLHFHYCDENEMRNINAALETVKLEHFRESYEGGVTKDRIYGIYKNASRKF